MNESQKKDLFDFTAENLSKNFESLGSLSGLQQTHIEGLRGVPMFAAPQCSEICLFGENVTLRLQIFYDMQNALKYLGDSLPSATEAKVIDFFNEVCNMTYGKIKHIFTDQSLNTDGPGLKLHFGHKKRPHL